MINLHASLLNSHVSYLYWVSQLTLLYFSQQVLFWSRESLSRVLEGVGYSFKSIDPKLAIWCLALQYLCNLGSNESCVP